MTILSRAVTYDGEKIHIPLKTDDAVRGLLKVKLASDMRDQERRKKKITKGKKSARKRGQ